MNNLDVLGVMKRQEMLPRYLDETVVRNKSFIDIMNELAEAEIIFVKSEPDR